MLWDLLACHQLGWTCSQTKNILASCSWLYECFQASLDALAPLMKAHPRLLQLVLYACCAQGNWDAAFAQTRKIYSLQSTCMWI